MEKQKNIPQLRFPEYEGDWEKVKFTDCCELIHGFQFRDEHFVEEGLPVVKIGNLIENKGISLENATYIDEGRAKEFLKYTLNKGDVLMALTGGTLGKVSVVDKDYGIIFQNYRVGKFKSLSNSVQNYIYILLQSSIVQNRVKSLVNEAAQPNFGKQDFDKIKFHLPTLPEQQKIASFFTAIDQKISQLKHKKTLLEQYKKGVMQKIFSQAIRFKDDDGKEFPKWEKRKLGDVGKTYNGLTGKSKDDFGQGKSYIQYKQIFDDSKIDITRFEFVRISDREKQSRVIYGDVFFTTSSETPDEVGTSSVLLDEVDEVYLNSFCFGYRSSLEVLFPQFSRYLFRNELLRKKINKLSQGSTRYNLSKNEFMKTLIELPSIQEQTKIANFLSAIDDKINHTQTQIEKADVWKKGLMQQMFC